MYPAGDEEDITLQFALLRSSKVSASPLLTFFASSCPFFGWSCDHQRTVGSNLLVCRLLLPAVIPVLGAVGILAQSVTGCCQDNIGTIVVKHIRSAESARYPRFLRKGLAYCLIAGLPHCDKSTSPISYPSFTSSVSLTSPLMVLLLLQSLPVSGRNEVYVQFVNLLYFPPQPSRSS